MFYCFMSVKQDGNEWEPLASAHTSEEGAHVSLSPPKAFIARILVQRYNVLTNFIVLTVDSGTALWKLLMKY